MNRSCATSLIWLPFLVIQPTAQARIFVTNFCDFCKTTSYLSAVNTVKGEVTTIPMPFSPGDVSLRRHLTESSLWWLPDPFGRLEPKMAQSRKFEFPAPMELQSLR